MHWLNFISQSNITTLFAAAAGMAIILGGISLISYRYSLRGIKSRTVGDGQHGTARWATCTEIHQTYTPVKFIPQAWREKETLPDKPGIILGSEGRKNEVTALREPLGLTV